jgi:hypothetical protein
VIKSQGKTETFLEAFSLKMAELEIEEVNPAEELP